MRRLGLMPVALVFALCFMVGCSRAPHEREWRSLSSQERADKLVTEVVYIKDPSTNLCYVYYWGGCHDGGPAITVVPESAIPVDRLKIGRVIDQ